MTRQTLCDAFSNAMLRVTSDTPVVYATQPGFKCLLSSIGMIVIPLTCFPPLCNAAPFTLSWLTSTLGPSSSESLLPPPPSSEGTHSSSFFHAMPPRPSNKSSSDAANRTWVSVTHVHVRDRGAAVNDSRTHRIRNVVECLRPVGHLRGGEGGARAQGRVIKIGTGGGA